MTKRGVRESRESFGGSSPGGVPFLAVRDVVVFPYMVLAILVGRRRSLAAVRKASEDNNLLMVAAQRDEKVEDPCEDDVYRVGTLVQVLRVMELPEGGVRVLVQGLLRARITGFVQKDPYFAVSIESAEGKGEPAKVTMRTLAQMRHIRDQLERTISLGRMIAPDVLALADKIERPGKLADVVAGNLGLSVQEAQSILETTDAKLRLKAVGEVLNREFELVAMQHKIQAEAKEEMSKTQREYFLREQLKAIQKELGEVDDKTEELNELRGRMTAQGMPACVEEEASKQLQRLEKMHPESAEATMVRTYLEWLTELPWSVATEDQLDVRKAARILDEDHYDLEKVKERILEYLSVRKLKKDSKGPILCFVGPPGVGKTSLGRSIARAMGRKFVRVSLGGMRDEAEIRGHRRTYVGALPGRIIQGMKQAGSSNPVFMMDEVDKIGVDFRGDPSAALLEVLDPDQNFSFRDHYLGVPFDLSKVMFIMTANLVEPIPATLRDRMEIIRLSGYTEEEKMAIAAEYLLPRQTVEHGISRGRLCITPEALQRIISRYTREAGLRNLERELAKICRKVAKRIADGQKRTFRITPGQLTHYLGVERFIPESEQEMDEAGVTTGLAWTETGGEVVFVEATVMRGKGALMLTGHLGDVMKESAQAALSYTRSRGKALGLQPNYFGRHDVHIHVPAGAVPKDGPSSGLAMAMALISAITGLKVRRDVAMAGEITLRGRVLPVDGIKEKVLAAKRAGIRCVVLPKNNEQSLEELPKNVRRQMVFHFVSDIDQALEQVFVSKFPLAGEDRGVAVQGSEPAPAQAAVSLREG